MSIKLGVLISGSGTNLQALIDAIAAGKLDASIELVVSSRPSAYGLKRAEAAGIQTLTLSKEIYADPMVADEVIATELRRAGVDYVLMAGYMRMVHDPILASFPNRVVNIHPALLPSFKGAHAIQDAFDYGVKVTGVTVHFANSDYDCGPIIAQRPVEVEEGWTVDQLEARIHEVEHQIYPHVAQLLAEGSTAENVVLDSQKSYSNRFHSSGGNAAYSVMANTLRGIYGSDVLIATGNSFTGNVLKAGYTEKMAGDMIMPNSLSAYSSKMSGAELKETVKNFVEGYEGGFIPFNRGSLPVFSGISVEIKETDDGYTLSNVTMDGKKVQDNDTFTVTCLAIPKHMEAYPTDENIVFDGGDISVDDTWTAYVSDGDAILAEPEDYMTLR